MKTWHDTHVDGLTFGQRAADKFASIVGSWTFVIAQTALLALWILANTIGYIPWRWDIYPFILLNLALSFQAAYSSPILMMSQNRQGERDRVQAEHDYTVNVQAKEEIEALQKSLARLEIEKLDKIINTLQSLTTHTKEIRKKVSK